MGHFAIGIDLGTTNCALAAIELDQPSPTIPTVFSVRQFVELGEIESRPLLPSFCYIPLEQEADGFTDLFSAGARSNPVVGQAARVLGSRIPSRLVSSAKSWLCHPGVDRRARILPWQSEGEFDRMSPVEASAHYLRHLREAWNAEPGRRPEDFLEHQHIALTIPASFDEVARELTVEAASKAGLPHVNLLEEPQAAFYQWVESSNEPPLESGSVCVVVDCGGGTTDFSLLAVVEKEGGHAYERIAVGDHLLLGGDNIDLAIARHVEAQLSPHRRLDLSQWWNLVLDARRLKEVMLKADAPESLPVVVLGRGRRVIGDNLKVEVTRDQVRAIALDGFFPRVARDEYPAQQSTVGFQEFGLPFVSDPSITKHLSAFLDRHRDQILEAAPGCEGRPAAILFNGGVFNAEVCRQRLIEVMTGWYGSDWKPRILETSSLDLAVACGAAHFARIRQQGGRRIRSGASRSFYIGVSGEGGRSRYLCVAPYGLEEGASVTLEEPALEVQLGEPVVFPLFASNVRTKDKAGAVIDVEADQLGKLPPLATVLRGGKRAGRKRMAVRLESRLTDIGTMEISCVSTDGNNRWKLSFATRVAPELADSADSPQAETTVDETWSDEVLGPALDLIQQTYAKSAEPSHPRRVAELPKQLEQSLGSRRSEWTLSLLRALWESLASVADRRGQSNEHEARWYNLAGFFLRPGWGDVVDPFRVEQLWKMTHAGVVNPRSDQAWTEYWTMMRRIAGGLEPNRQWELSKRLLAYLPVGGSRKPPRRVNSHEWAEIWRAVASLEHLPVATKVELGQVLMKDVSSPAVYHFWSLARLGSRVPLYGPANVVIPKAEAERWTESLLRQRYASASVAHDRDFAIAQIARASGDRARDIDPALRDQVVEHLTRGNAPRGWIGMVAEPTRRGLEEQSKLLGDVLPPALRVLSVG